MLIDVLSKPVQRAFIAEGMALGVTAIRGDGFTFNAQKMIIEFAFQHAWRDWRHRASFPDIRAQLDRNDLLRIIDRHSRQRSGTDLAGWASSWPFEPYVSPDYTLDEVGVALEEASGVPLVGWTDLATHFLEDLESQPRPAERSTMDTAE